MATTAINRPTAINGSRAVRPTAINGSRAVRPTAMNRPTAIDHAIDPAIDPAIEPTPYYPLIKRFDDETEEPMIYNN